MNFHVDKLFFFSRVNQPTIILCEVVLTQLMVWNLGLDIQFYLLSIYSIKKTKNNGKYNLVNQTGCCWKSWNSKCLGVPGSFSHVTEKETGERKDREDGINGMEPYPECNAAFSL